MASTHTFHTIDLSDGKTSQRTLQTVSTVTLPVPASPALSRTSTLVDDGPETSKQGALSVSDFEGIKILGRGAQGVVTLVKDRYTGRSHALKVTKAAKLKPKSYLHLFEEQTTLKRLAGIPWFVELQGSFYDSAHFFLLMKYYPNGSLGSFLGRGRLSPVDARRFAAELIFALGLLREKRVVHGDIKPDNLLLDNRGHLVVADFGMARSFNEPSPLAPWKEADATCRGVGTPVYMAPEVWRKPNAPQSYPADVWSAGVTIYEMLTGRLPFGPHSKYLPALETCFATIRKPLTFPDDLDIDVDDDARDLVHKMLQVDASKRPSIAAIKKHPYFMSM
ncbi:kinase-like domain-containing protein [Rhodofomes roseus]|uniref:non-specific serine/threonine protein kinase n=1 Tax=Rhodofomes roseus TaxID=34475 RepID=A0ABQ8KP97_9APHY|nr:kinase-like domain-containing protein [Rhodofomes roseus]KAH9840259.1 kinase-like domain-containing protein [Rhodofomes roseus]